MGKLQLVKFYLRWPINVLLKVLKLKPRDPDIWLFGSWNGERYADNSKYFFEYVVSHSDHIRAIWITKNPNIKEDLRKKGYECYLHNEKQGRYFRLKAGKVFFTNGSTDFGNYDLCQGAVKVALWHGMPLKRLTFATNNLKKRGKNPFRLLQYWSLKIYNNGERTYTIATSKKSKEFLIESFEVKPETVLITGQPRNDVLFNKKMSDQIKKQLKHKSDYKFILYLPTHRSSDTKDHSIVDSVIDNLNSDPQFLHKLEENKICLYIKPHPNRLANSNSKNENIKLIKNNIDSQKLMSAADALITDYSSVFIDYALTMRPIYFYVPDLEEYNQGKNGLFLMFEEFSNYWFTCMKKFKETVLCDNKHEKFGLENTEKINRIYDDPKLIKGSYSASLVKKLVKFI